MADQGYYLSDKTYGELQQLIGQRDGEQGGGIVASGSRQLVHVRVTGAPTSGKYPCVPTSYKPYSAAWEDYGGTCYVYEANGKDLENGERYLAVRFGLDASGNYIYVCDNAYPLIGCHLDYIADPDDSDKLKLKVTPDTLAGCGLKVEEDTPCDKLAVDPDALAGDGLEAGDDCELSVKPGCGLRIQEDGAVGLDLEAICVEAIKGINDDDAGCSISLRYGCHLDLQPDPLEEGAEAVYVTVGTMAGDGLQVQPGTSGACDKLKVDTGCGLEIADAKVAVKAVDLAGDGLATGTGCTLNVDPGCGLRIDGDGKVALDLEAIAVDGLVGDNTNCTLGVNLECGLQYVGTSGIGVDAAALAGTGLVAGPSTCTLNIDTTESDGPAFSCITAISMFGCGIEYTVTPFTIKVNPAGVFIGLESGEPATSTLSIGEACCDECDDDVFLGGGCVDSLGGIAVVGCEATSGTTLGSTVVMGCESTIGTTLGDTVVMGCGATGFEQHTFYTYTCVEGVCTSQPGTGGTYTTLVDCEASCGE